MKRPQEDYHIAYREWKKRYLDLVQHNEDFAHEHIGCSAYEIHYDWAKQVGRFRKKKAFDCGNPQCKLCHSDKFPKREKTRQEIEADLKFQEGIEEIEVEFTS